MSLSIQPFEQQSLLYTQKDLHFVQVGIHFKRIWTDVLKARINDGSKD